MPPRNHYILFISIIGYSGRWTTLLYPKEPVKSFYCIIIAAETEKLHQILAEIILKLNINLSANNIVDQQNRKDFIQNKKKFRNEL